MNDLISKKSLIATIEKEAGMNIPEWLRETIMNASPERKKGEWIPCSEKLPEYETWNLWTDGKNVSVERCKQDAWDHFYPRIKSWFDFEDAVAWMPLPEPYRKEGD